MSEAWQTFVDEILNDPDCPPDVSYTFNPRAGTITFKRAKDAVSDQWQIAIPVADTEDDALIQIVNMHEKAVDRLTVLALRAQEQINIREAQDRCRDEIRDLTQAQQTRLETKREAIKTRFKAKRQN